MGRKRRCVGTQLDATVVTNHVQMRGTQGTQEMESVTSGRGASASHVEYIFANVSYTILSIQDFNLSNSIWSRPEWLLESFAIDTS